MSVFSFDSVKGFLMDVAKDFLNETAFEQFYRIYSSICTKFAREYLEEGSGTPPSFLKRFRKKFYKVGKLSVIVVDEIDKCLCDREVLHNRVSKFEAMFSDGKYSGNAAAIIEVKSKSISRRRKATKSSGYSEEDD